MREGVAVLYGLQRRPEMLYGLQRRSEIGWQLTRRSGRSPRSTLAIAITVMNSAALPFVPDEDLQAEGDGACRSLRNQAATREGAKR
jgi:hypothetical protein